MSINLITSARSLTFCGNFALLRFGSEGKDAIIGDYGNPIRNIVGQADVIFGDRGDDAIAGGNGNDTIEAGKRE